MYTDMKKIKNILSLLVVALIGLSLTACSNDDLGTNQYQGGVSLNAYGPNPVMRGGQLRFVGSNLDQIASITIPGVGEITNIEVVKSGVPSEIRITVPKDGPEVGYVTLKTKTDQTITTKTQIEYIEGIEVTAIPEDAVMPGQTIRIEGDYLNLIYSLAFADGVLVSSSDFVEQDRYYIDVVVPEEAKSGKLELYTADLTIQRTKEEEDALTYQTIVTEDALTVGLPSTSKIASPRGEAEVEGEITAKAGEKITLDGAYYNVISAIKFGDVEITEFEVSKDGTTLTFTLPAEAPSGIFSLVCKSEEEVPVATLVTVKPSNGVAAPNPVKAGSELTISGQDMDVVTAVQFEGADALSGDKITVAADKVVVGAVPETATEGKLKLVMANGESVEVAFTLVKPAVTAYNANHVSAGAELQITGTDLDLVKSVTFGEATNADDKFEVSADGTTITVTVPMEGTSGKPKLNLANGTSVEAPELTIDEAVFCYATALPGAEEEIKAGSTMTITVANSDVLTGVEMNGVACQYILSGDDKDQLIIGIPDTTPANGKLHLISSNGDITYDITIIPATEVTLKLWTGMIDLDWGKPDAIYLDASVFENIPAGARMTLTCTVNGWTQIWFEATDDVHLKFTDTTDGAYAFDRSFVPSDMYPDFAWGVDNNMDITVVLTQDVLDLIKEKGTFNIRGGNKGSATTILTKLVVNYTIELEKDIVTEFGLTNMDGTAITFPYQFTWNDTGRFLIAGDKLQSAGLKKGSVLSFYKSTSAKGQVQINYNTDGWPNVSTVADWDPKLEVLTYEFTSETAAQAITYGLAIQGDLGGITKMTILP